METLISYKVLYDEMQDRLTHLESQEPTEENKGRIRELTLTLIKVHQIILANLSDEVDAVQFANWLIEKKWMIDRFDGEVGWRRYISTFKDEYKTSAELYKIFKLQKVK